MIRPLTVGAVIALLILETDAAGAQATTQGNIPSQIILACQKNPTGPYCPEFIKLNPQLFTKAAVGVIKSSDANAPPAAVVKSAVPAPSTPPPSAAPPAPFSPPGAGLCDTAGASKLFVRAADQMDNFNYDNYLINPTSTAADAKGASVSYTDNKAMANQTATIDASASYLWFGGLCDSPFSDRNIPFITGYAVAPFVLEPIQEDVELDESVVIP